MVLPTGRALLDPDKILQEAGLTEGQTYVDFGCGALGHFVLPAAVIVGNTGKIWALDILKTALDVVNSRASAGKISNLQTVWGDFENEKGAEEIPAASVDLASLINTSGLLLKSPWVVKNIKHVLKTGGHFLLVDWRPNSFLGRFLSKHKTDPTKLLSLLETNGFRSLKSFSIGRNHFGLLLEKI